MVDLKAQISLADETREFLKNWGLKAKYVAGVCQINEKVLSRFMNHKLTLSDVQMQRLKNYMSDYERRNS